MKKQLGIIQWFDGEEGMVFCPETKNSYYVHCSSFKNFPALANKDDYRKIPVLFTLYTNLYMSQVDKIFTISSLKDMPGDLKSSNSYSIAWNMLCEQLGAQKHKIIVEWYMNKTILIFESISKIIMIGLCVYFIVKCIIIL